MDIEKVLTEARVALVARGCERFYKLGCLGGVHVPVQTPCKVGGKSPEDDRTA